MSATRRGFGRRAVLAAASAAPIAKARAQADWPNRPVRFVVAWPPGGGADLPTRTVAGPIQRSLGQPIVVDNRGGASGSIGAAAVAQAAPDGRTVLAHTSSFISHPLLLHGTSYDPSATFAPVTQVVASPLVLVARPDHPAQTLADLLERLRRTPGGIAYASSGAGGGPHLVSAMLLRRAGVTATHVAHRGGASSAAAILGGHAAFAFSTLPQAVPLVQEGRLRALAVSTAERLPNLPEVPTVAEQGFPGFALSDWLGFWMPAGTPAEPIAYLREATAAALRQPEVRQRLARIGMTPVGSTTAAFVALLKDQRARLAELIRTENVRLE